MRRSRRRREQRQEAPPAVHELTIPDELLAWSTEPEVARSFLMPIGHEVQILIKRAAKRPLAPKETDRLLALLEGLCCEAVARGMQHLLIGFDLFTADWLGLKFTFDTPSGPIAFGRDGDFTYGELHAMVAAGVTPEAAAFAREARELVTSVFPQARIDAMIGPEDGAGSKCFGCGVEGAAVMLSMESGSEYCPKCYSDLTEPWTMPEDLARKLGKKRT
jgi:hypothetical protein